MAISASPTSKAFGSKASGTTTDQVITLTPDSTNDSIHGVTLTGPNANQFSLTETYDAVAPGVQNEKQSTIITAASTFTVSYKPTAAGAHSAQVEVHHNGPGGAFTTVVPVSGTGT